MLLPALATLRRQAFLTANDAVVSVPIDISSVTKVTGAGSAAITLPVRCSSDGHVLVRPISPSDAADIVSMARDGSVHTFSIHRLTDVADPVVTAFYAGADSVYLLVEGLEGSEALAAPKRPDTAPPIKRQFAVRFDNDGTFRKLTKLDIPFRGLQLAEFTDGELLVAGFDEQQRKSVVALVTSDGRLDRPVELKGDLDINSDAIAERAKQVHAAQEQMPRVLMMALSATDLMPTGDRVLLFRRRQPLTVFVISRAGVVSAVRFKLPEGFTATEIVPGNRDWAIVANKPTGEGRKVETVVFSVDPSTGRLLKKYTFISPIGAALACYVDDSLTFVRKPQDGGFELVTASPAPASTSVKQGQH